MKRALSRFFGEAGTAVRRATVLAAVLASAGVAWGAEPASARPKMLADVAIDQRLDQPVPPELQFRDETGRLVALKSYFGEKPIVLALVYYQCPMLCTMTLNGLVAAMKPLDLTPGKDFTVLTVSFDPTEKHPLAAAKKRSYLSQYGRPGAEEGWHFLTGDRDAVQKLTAAVGFRYRYDAETAQYAHAAGLVVLTPSGKVSRYFYGVEYSTRDLRLALVDSAEGKIGSAVDQILLYCYRYDPVHGKYGLVVMNVIRLLGTATVLALGAFVVLANRREKRRRPDSA
ncbi:MAG: SCO family protein [Candidatus Wallbacteria bacterium]|nr:SCO family protein [Candidatus Wallbacteria bacterium]